MALKKLIIKEVLINGNKSELGMTLFRDTRGSIFIGEFQDRPAGSTVYYTTDPASNEIGSIASDGSLVTYVEPVPSVPNIIGAKYFEISYNLKDPNGDDVPWTGWAAYANNTKTLSIEQFGKWNTDFYIDDNGDEQSYYYPSTVTRKYTGEALSKLEKQYKIDFNGDRVIGATASSPVVKVAPGVSTNISDFTRTFALAESGSTSFTWTAKLTTKPTDNVVVTYKSSDSTEGLFSNGKDSISLIFTPDNWNQNQSIKISGADDSINDGDIRFTVTGSAKSKLDTNYWGQNRNEPLILKSINFINADDDKPDQVKGDDGNDQLQGGSGPSDVYGFFGNDTIYGGKGNDRLYGGYGDDIIYGQEGNDKIEGEQGDDYIQGDAGDDNILGGTGNDDISGGSGNDILNGGEDADKMMGGEGSDTYYVDNPDDYVSDSGKTGTDTIYVMSYLGENYNLGDGLDDLVIDSKAGNVSVTGNTSDNDITGNIGNNTIDGGLGNDEIDGGSGDDCLLGGDGFDSIIGGSGRDVFRYTSLLDSDLTSNDWIKDLVIGSDSIDAVYAVSKGFIAGTKSGSGLRVTAFSETSIQKTLTASVFSAKGAAVFTYQSKSTTETYLALNDNVAGFQASSDSLIKITGFTGSLANLAII